MTFELRQEGDYTIVLFTHGGWREPVEFMHHCSTKWATYLMSLKSLVETGRRRPRPASTSRSTTGTEAPGGEGGTRRGHSLTITPVDGNESELQFRHHGLTSQLDCIDQCTRGWDHFLVSLRDHVEVGRGMPRASDADDARRR